MIDFLHALLFLLLGMSIMYLAWHSRILSTYERGKTLKLACHPSPPLRVVDANDFEILKAAAYDQAKKKALEGTYTAPPPDVHDDGF